MGLDQVAWVLERHALFWVPTASTLAVSEVRTGISAGIPGADRGARCPLPGLSSRPGRLVHDLCGRRMARLAVWIYEPSNRLRDLS